MSSIDLFKVDRRDMLLGLRGVFDRFEVDCVVAGAWRSGGGAINAMSREILVERCTSNEILIVSYFTSNNGEQ